MYPVIDEEYFEWIDILKVVYNAVAAKRFFVAIELGARYGTWCTRAGVAYRLLSGNNDFKVIGLEGFLTISRVTLNRRFNRI
jgi:hypothetical protein